MQPLFNAYMGFIVLRRSIKVLFFTLTTFSLILLGIGSFWLYNYATDTIAKKLIHTAHEKSETIRYEMIRFYDQMIYDFLQTQSEQAIKMDQAQRYFKKYGINAPLEPLQKMLEDTQSSYDISLINRAMIVERTTFTANFSLDFKQYPFVPQLFNSLFDNPYKTDISKPLYESSTSDFKRYTTQVSRDGHYIIQLGQSLKEGKSLHHFMRNLQKTIPTLRSHSVYTVYSSNNEAISVKEIWSQRLLGMKKNDILKIWDGVGNFQQVMKRIDPTSSGLFTHPKLFLYPHLNIIFKHDIRKEVLYWENDRYIHMVMLPFQSYYNQLEKSYSFLVLELDETQAYADARHLKNTMLIAWGILTLLILSISLLFYRRIIKPITILESHMHQKMPLTDTTILAKGDEISKISRTYNWLLSDLKNEIKAKQTLLNQFKTFTANAIHQVRTPLSVIKIAHTMIDDDTHKEAKLHILSSLISMEHLYDSLAFTLQNDRIELPISLLNFSSILEERVNLFAPVASSLDTLIVSTIHSNISVKINQSELEYLIDNNLSNALKYGQPFKPIILSLSQSPKELILEFESYGNPITDTSAIFERYTRQDESKQGSGIGLHIVATICERYHIMIKVTYEDGKNCFRYFFPIK